MTNGPCPPTPPPGSRGMTPCEAAFELRQAYFKLITGNHRVVVRFNERWTEYTKGDVKALLLEIKRYEHLCANPGASLAPVIGAMRAGPYTTTPGIHGGITRPRRY